MALDHDTRHRIPFSANVSNRFSWFQFRPLLREISSFCLTKFWFPRTISSIDFLSVIDCKQTPLTVKFASCVLQKLGDRHRLHSEARAQDGNIILET